MIQRKRIPTGRTLRPRTNRLWCATLALAAAVILTGTACDEEAAVRAFRDAASANLQTGMKSLSDGFIDGLFAVFELGDGQGDSGDNGTTEGG